jgi:LytS/YehU family sensor histidine kinase
MFSGRQNDSIEYRLPPYDKIWRKGTTATYTNLSGGIYTLQIRECGPGNTYSTNTQLQLEILPPFWKKNWFKLLATLVLVLTSYLAFRLRLKQQTEKQARQLQLAQSELKAIRSQMNPHFIFNCLTAIDGLIATKQNIKASEYLGKFSKLVRQVLQLSEKQMIPLRQELDTLKTYLQLEQLRMQEGFSFKIKADEHLLDQLELPPLLLQPFVENAILHGLKNSLRSEKHIEISVIQNESAIEFCVKDNGAGRKNKSPVDKESKEHVSMGTHLTRERLKMMEKVMGVKTTIIFEDKTDPDNLPAGTNVTIVLNPK